jgi:hypothetical protein
MADAMIKAGLLTRNSLIAHAIDTALTTRGVHQPSRLLPLLMVAVKICYASRLPFGSLRCAFAPLRSALTRKFLPAVRKESGDGSVGRWRKGGE